MADSFHDEMVDDAPATGHTTTGADDIAMTEGAATTAANNDSSELPFAEGVPEDPVPERTTFLQYLSSPAVTLLIGSGDSETILTAHQGLLVQSPYFAEACAEFADDGSVGAVLFYCCCGELVVRGEGRGKGGVEMGGGLLLTLCVCVL